MAMSNRERRMCGMVHAGFSACNGRFRDEYMNGHWFPSIECARAKTWVQCLVIFKVGFYLDVIDTAKVDRIPAWHRATSVR